MGNLPSFVSGVIDVIDVFGLIQFSHAQPHSFYEVGVYEVVGSALRSGPVNWKRPENRTGP
jgi:hypothetical protein